MSTHSWKSHTYILSSLWISTKCTKKICREVKIYDYYLCVCLQYKCVHFDCFNFFYVNIWVVKAVCMRVDACIYLCSLILGLCANVGLFLIYKTVIFIKVIKCLLFIVFFTNKKNTRKTYETEHEGCRHKMEWHVNC